jgi:hypothetical protein
MDCIQTSARIARHPRVHKAYGGRPQALELKLIGIGVSIGIHSHRLVSIKVVTK